MLETKRQEGRSVSKQISFSIIVNNETPLFHDFFAWFPVYITW